MLEFNDNVLKMTRGDTVYIDLVITTPTGQIYDVKNTDVITFNVRKEPTKSPNTKPLFTKTFSNHMITIKPSDTLYLQQGTYYYDTTIVMDNGQTVETVNNGKFILNY